MLPKKKNKIVLTPNACFDHDLDNYYITVELPGVTKDNVELNMSEQSFCVKGIREDSELLGCWYLAHSVQEGKAKAKYDNGLLSVMVPIKKPVKGRKILVE